MQPTDDTNKSPSVAEGSPFAPSDTSTNASVAIPSYLLPSIASLLCCCFPSGIVALLYSVQVTLRLSEGDIAGAQRASIKARRWVIITGILGVAMWFAIMLLQALTVIA